MHFSTFLVLCSVDSLFNQFPLDGHLVLFLSFACTNYTTVDNLLYKSFHIFFQYNFGLDSEKEDY